MAKRQSRFCLGAFLNCPLFWNVTLCHWTRRFRRFEKFFWLYHQRFWLSNPKEEKVVWNIGNHSSTKQHMSGDMSLKQHLSEKPALKMCIFSTDCVCVDLFVCKLERRELTLVKFIQFPTQCILHSVFLKYTAYIDIPNLHPSAIQRSETLFSFLCP